MRLPHNAHVAVVDGSQFRFFQNVGPPDAVELRGIETAEVDLTNRSAGIRDQEATDRPDGGRHLDELSHAAGVAERLNHLAITGEIDKLVVIADPSSLGEMRRHYHTELETALLCELDRTLTNSRVEDIARAIESA